MIRLLSDLKNCLVTLLLLWGRLRGKEISGVDVDVVPEVLLEAVVVVAAAASAATVLTTVTPLRVRRRRELPPSVSLLASIEIGGAALVPDPH